MSAAAAIAIVSAILMHAGIVDNGSTRHGLSAYFMGLMGVTASVAWILAESV